MCIAVPMRVVALVGFDGVVEMQGVRKEVNFRLLPQVEPGDYVLVHAGYAIEKIDLQAAFETLELLKEFLEPVE